MKRAMLRDFDAVIFDLDGTLVESMGMWHRIDVLYLGRYGLTVPEDLQKVLEGKSFHETAIYFKERFSIPDSVEEIEATWHRMAAQQYRDTVPLKKGASQFIALLKKEGIFTAIASSNSRGLVFEAIDAHGLTNQIDVVTACDEVKVNKPDPAVYLATAERLSVKPEKCLVFEDIPNGILAGKRAGMTVIAVSDPYSDPVEESKRRLADGYVKDFADFMTRSMNA